MRKFLIAAVAGAAAVALTTAGTVTAGADVSSPEGLQAAKAATARYSRVRWGSTRLIPP
jgi:hypothetical protein